MSDNRESASERILPFIGLFFAIIVPIAVGAWIGFAVYSVLTAPDCPSEALKNLWAEECSISSEAGQECVSLTIPPECK